MNNYHDSYAHKNNNEIQVDDVNLSFAMIYYFDQVLQIHNQNNYKLIETKINDLFLSLKAENSCFKINVLFTF
jgi:hypothetical protein